jgi:hypothetical protein
MMLAPPDALVRLCEPWNHFYSNSKLTVTIVTFLHTGGVLLAGGFAIAADRATLRALKLPASQRGPTMRELAGVHRWVITGLAVIVASGVAQLASDLESFWGSWIFWTKLTFVAVLLANGYWMTRVEDRLRLTPDETSPAWKTLGRIAVASMVLWFATAFVGIALENFA